MKRTFTEKEKQSIFDDWKRGLGFSDIAYMMSSTPGSIFTVLRNTGGIKPKQRKLSPHHLTLAEREEIRAGLSAKKVSELSQNF